MVSCIVMSVLYCGGGVSVIRWNRATPETVSGGGGLFVWCGVMWFGCAV